MTILILLLCLLIFFIIKNTFLTIRLADVSMTTGGVKTGKSLLTVFFVVTRYRLAVLRWFLYRYTLGLIPKYQGKFLLFRKLFKGKIEKPLLYSNIPLRCGYVPITLDHIERKVRFAYRSVVFLDEVSLIADSMSFRLYNSKTGKYSEVNTKTKVFFKLFGHEVGGKLIMNTQCVRDVHYNIKRSLNSYLWIQSAIKWIPFVYVCKVREMAFLDDMSMNVFDSTVEDSCRIVLIPKFFYRYYDSRCYSVLTDGLPLGDTKVVKPKFNLKQRSILSFGGDFDDTEVSQNK